MVDRSYGSYDLLGIEKPNLVVSYTRLSLDSWTGLHGNLNSIYVRVGGDGDGRVLKTRSLHKLMKWIHFLILILMWSLVGCSSSSYGTQWISWWFKWPRNEWGINGNPEVSARFLSEMMKSPRLNDFHAPIHSIRLRVNGMTPTLGLIHFKTNQRRALNLIKNNLI